MTLHPMKCTDEIRVFFLILSSLKKIKKYLNILNGISDYLCASLNISVCSAVKINPGLRR